jgi:hypothetical protein
MKYKYVITYFKNGDPSQYFRIHPNGSHDRWNFISGKWEKVAMVGFKFVKKSETCAYWDEEITEEQMFFELL